MDERGSGELVGIETEAVTRFMRANVAGASGPLQIEKLSGGSSNLTFHLRDDGGEWVLRRPPVGKTLSTAHDMLREARVQRALRDTPVPVPSIAGVCADESLIGAPFYLMEFLDGVVYTTAETTASLDEAQARAASYELVDVLAALHNVDYDSVGLSELGRPDGFLERQVGRWCAQWEKSKQREIPLIDELAKRLRAALPEQGPHGIVHGDFSFNNTMFFGKDPTKMQALLDWEMSTLGDPLADLGMLLVYWNEVGEMMWADRGGQAHRSSPGFPTSDALLARYETSSGRSVAQVDFFQVLATFKLAVIVEGAFARQRMGTFVSDDSQDGAGEMTEKLATLALDMANRSSVVALRG